MTNSEEINEYVRELLLLSVSELKERDRIEKDQLQVQLKALEEEHSKLNERYRNADNVVNEINKTRSKVTKKIEKLEKNRNDLLRMFSTFVEDMVNATETFRKSYEKLKGVKKMFVEKCLDIRGSRKDFTIRFQKLHAEIKEAEILLEHRKASSAANLQVLESKLACLAKDQEECSKKAKELKSLSGKNHKDLLKEMEQQEENMKLEFSDLSANLAECYKWISNLNDEYTSLTVETDKLSLEVAVEEKCNQKLNTELKNEEENLEQTVLDMLTLELNGIHYDNLELAKILRNGLVKNEENVMEIQLLEREKADIENEHQEYDILKDQKFKELKKIQTDIVASIEDKNSLKLKVDDFKNYVLDNQELKQLMKNKIADKEEALKKQEERINFTQFTATKSSKATGSKTSKTARPKGKKNKESSNLVEPITIFNEEQSEPTIFSSFSSGESDMNLSMSSTMAGSKPDIMNILANLSSNQFGFSKSSSRRNTDSTGK
ncbi:unnamed protein product [Chironomus riparius]|uniref:Uncharacterized protein n=1 Tax=Chironomus riparius TaxID=315576 RepID=A0A9N9RWJ2_9DIPT|nr:unnamed protein product [Chironomus riparius]